MKKEKLLIICIIVLLVMTLMTIRILVWIKDKNKSDLNNNITVGETGSTFLEGYANTQNRIISRNAYFDINSCMKVYLDNLNTESSIYFSRNSDGNFVKNISENEIKQKIMNMLSENYITSNNITIENLYNVVKTYKEQTIYVPLEANSIQDGDIKSFLVHGLVENLEFKKADEIFAVLNVDPINLVFSVEPIYGTYSSISEISIKELDNKINVSNNNKYTMKSTNYEDVATEYMNLYKRLSLGDSEKMYNIMDENYKNLRFGNKENFEVYIQSNAQKIYGTRLEKFQVTSGNGVTQYICMDQYGKYYIFRETSPNKYTVILDQHTIDLPEFVEKYSKASNENKVAMNTEKIKDALNTKDYKYVYDKLDNTFKQNNFAEESSFEQFINNNLFEINKFEYTNIEERSGIYIFTLNVSDYTEKDTKVVKLNIIMQLGEGTDFVISFNVEG